MPSTLLESEATFSATEDAASYRALHAGAIVGVLVAVCSLVYPLVVSSLTEVSSLLLLAAIPLAALAICGVSLRAIRANQEIYTGQRVAAAGALLAAVSLVGGSAYGGFIFATEVPDGYARISHQEMKPSADDELAGRPVPESIAKLIASGQEVFIKGYIRQDSVDYRVGNKQFLLVRDNNECCFGDRSKVMYFDQIMVTLDGDLTVDYATRLFRVGGVLSVRPGDPAQGEPVLVYSLKADYVK
jgi:hypothetical protein